MAANLSNSDIGSAPGDSTIIIGTLFDESLNVASISNGGGTMNFSPSSFSSSIRF
jgi:ABC-type branched-subunit amino acid transport system substrate-binding protein